MSCDDTNRRMRDLGDFYDLLTSLGECIGGTRQLSECSARMDWPQRGVYFFFEEGEHRSDSGVGMRVVRVGTHALTHSSRTTMWNRLSQHRGSTKGGGNHRGSIFRLIVGSALKARRTTDVPASWGIGADPGAAATRLRLDRQRLVDDESNLEIAVSQRIGAMPFLWLRIDDDPGPSSLRGYIERNAIALLSNFQQPTLDPPSEGWLGAYSDRERVRRSGLWNSNHVDESYDPQFIETLRHVVDAA